jgi:hypothetical protein
MNCEVSSASVSANAHSSRVLDRQNLITTKAALENHSEKVGWHYGENEINDSANHGVRHHRLRNGTGGPWLKVC